MEKLHISLNAECPCYSGEKYKKCHMGKLSLEQEEYFAFLQYNNKIKNKLLRWFTLELSIDEQNYYAKGFGVKDIMVIFDQENPAEFFEWLFYQANERNSNEKMLKVIIERYPTFFSPDELLVIRERLNTNQAGIFEVLSSDEKSWKITLKENNTKIVYEIMDRLGSLDSAIGDFILTRVEKIFSKDYLCGYGIRINRRSIEEFQDFLNKKYTSKKREILQLTYSDFMNLRFKELTLFKPRPIKFLSNDGNDLMLCEGNFNADKEKIEVIINYLRKNKDFVMIELKKIKEGFHADFIKRIKESKDYYKSNNTQTIQTSAISSTGERTEYSGSIKIKKDMITISSNSEETYKDLIVTLEKVIDEKLIAKREKIETPEEALVKDKIEKKQSKAEKKEVDIKKMEEEFLKEHYLGWCNQKIPALNNNTPRESMKTEEGRKLLKELLLDIKNMDEHKRKSGETSFPGEEFIRSVLKFYD